MAMIYHLLNVFTRDRDRLRDQFVGEFFGCGRHVFQESGIGGRESGRPAS